MKKKLYALFALFTALISLNLSAQQAETRTVEASGQAGTSADKVAGAPLNMVWEEVGPNNLGTICRSIVVTSSSEAWAGSVGGGLFKTTNGGSTWNAITSLSDNLTVSSIAVDGSTIFVGTGDAIFYQPSQDWIPSWDFFDPYELSGLKNSFHLATSTPGEGVFVSTDGGATWSNNNATWTGTSVPYNDKFMAVPKVAAQGGTVLVASLEGLYWSTDNLANITKCSGTSYFMSQPVVDIEFGDGNYVYAATRDSFYISTNGGQSFGAAINTGSRFPNPSAVPHNRIGGDRIEIAVAPSDKTILYVTGASNVNGNCNGVWKSTDNGTTWTRKAPAETATSTAFAPFGNQGRYAMTLDVDPSDPNSFLVGGQRLYSFDETDGLILASSDFYVPGITDDYVPKPIHVIAHDPTNPDRFYIGTDAEIVRSIDGGETYSLKTKGFNAGHMFNVSGAVDYKVIASERIRGLVYKPNASSLPSYQEFDDVFNIVGQVRYSLTNPNFIIAQGSDGGLVRSLSNGSTWAAFYGPADSTHPSLGADSLFIDRADADNEGGGLYDDGGAQITPWCFDEVIPAASLGDDSLIQNTPAYVYMCSRHFVWVVSGPFASIDSVARWSRITPDLINDALSPKEYMTAIAVSGDNSHTVVVATNYGKIYRIANANEPASLDITDSTRFAQIDGGTLPSRWITNLAFDPNDPNNLVVTFGGYENSDASMIYIANNALDAGGNVTWRSIDNTSTPPVPIYCAAFHPDPAIGALLIGREDGIYSTTDDWTNAGTTITWNSENASGMYNVPVFDITIRPYYQNPTGTESYKYSPDNTILIATHGRGIFRSTTLVSRDEDVTVAPVELDVKLYPNPVAGASTVELDLAKASEVNVDIYNITGLKVGSLGGKTYGIGVQKLTFDSEDLNAGIYFLNVRVKNSDGEFTKTIKSVVVK